MWPLEGVPVAYLVGVLVGYLIVRFKRRATESTPDPNPAPPSTSTKKGPSVLQEMKIEKSLSTDVEDPETCDDASEGLPTPSSISSSGQYSPSPKETDWIANEHPQSKKIIIEPRRPWVLTLLVRLYSYRPKNPFLKIFALLLTFLCWRSLSYSISIVGVYPNTLSSVGQPAPTTYHCNKPLCYSFSIGLDRSRTPTLYSAPVVAPTESSQAPNSVSPTTTLHSTPVVAPTKSQAPDSISPSLQRCVWDEKAWVLRIIACDNVQQYEAFCSDAYARSFLSPHDQSVSMCLELCVALGTDGICEGMLYFPDRVAHRQCYFKRDGDKLEFGESEKVVGYQMVRN